MTGLPRNGGSFGRPTGAYCPRCDGPMYERFPTSIDDAFRSFGHPPPGFDRSLEDTIKELRMNSGVGSTIPPSFAAAQQRNLSSSAAGGGGNGRSSSLRNLAGLGGVGSSLPSSNLAGEFRSSFIGPPDHHTSGSGGHRGNSSSHHQYSSTSSVNSSGGSTGAGGSSRPQAPLPSQPHSFPLHQPPPPVAAAASEMGAKDVSTTDRFCITVDVKDYQPDEIRVKTVDNTVVIEGKHEQKDGQGGQRVVSRNFNRSWTIPHDVDPNAITSRLNANGQLIVEAPRKLVQPPPIVREHMIPVNHQQQMPRRMF